MSGTLNATVLRSTYKEVLGQAIQQVDSLLKDSCMPGKIEGDFLYMDELNALNYHEVTGRHASTQNTVDTWDRRRVGLRRFTVAPLLDDLEKVAMGAADPKSALVEGSKRALKRAMDDVIKEAFDADVASGYTGGSTTSFDSNNVITCSSGITIATFRTLEETLISNEAWDEDEEKYLVIGPKEMNMIRQIDAYNSIEYNEQKSLGKAKRPPFFNFNIIVSNRLDVSGGVRACYAYTKSAMTFAMQKEIEVQIDRLPSANQDWQVYAELRCNALRVHEEGILKLNVTES